MPSQIIGTTLIRVGSALSLAEAAMSKDPLGRTPEEYTKDKMAEVEQHKRAREIKLRELTTGLPYARNYSDRTKRELAEIFRGYIRRKEGREA